MSYNRDNFLERDQLIEFYNESGGTLGGLERILNIQSGLNELKNGLEHEIRNSIIEVVEDWKKVIKRDEIKVQDKVEEIFDRFLGFAEYDEEIRIDDLVRNEFAEDEWFNIQVDYSSDYDYTFVDDLAGSLQFLELECRTFLRLRLTLLDLDFFIQHEIIYAGYPTLIEKNIDSKKEKKKRELDKKPGHHSHRKKDIQQKYKELKKKYPASTDSEVRSKIQDWYIKLTGKDISESTVRHHLGHK